MSATPQMPSTRRRPISGMSSPSETEVPPPEQAGLTGSLEPASPDHHAAESPAATVESARDAPKSPSSAKTRERRTATSGGAADKRAPERYPSADYASTRLVNFRIPVDLHDRFRTLVREVEERYPRLRHPSLTELLIALLEEGPQSANEVAELIRRKRVSENEDH